MQMTVGAALDELRRDGGTFVELFRHGSLAIEMYRPQGVDRQQPHSRDEVYVIAQGHGAFVVGGQRRTVQTGEVLFVAAGEKHRFEDFSDDFATWVFFYGPEGGEAHASDGDG